MAQPLFRERQNIPVVIADDLKDVHLLNFSKLDIDLSAEKKGAFLYKVVGIDGPTPIVLRGNKEYVGRVEELSNPILVTRTEKDPETGQQKCVVHSIIRRKLIFEKKPIFHFN